MVTVAPSRRNIPRRSGTPESGRTIGSAASMPNAVSPSANGHTPTIDRPSLAIPCWASRHARWSASYFVCSTTGASGQVARPHPAARTATMRNARRTSGRDGRAARHRGSYQLTHIVQLVDLPALLNDRLDLVGRQHEHRLIAELLLELLVAQRAMKVAQRLFDELRKPPSVAHLDFDVSLIFGDRAVAGSRRQFADALDGGIVDRFVGVFAQASLAAHEPDSRAVIHGELALEAHGDVLLVAQVEDQWRHAQPDGDDGRRIRSVFVVDLNGAVDRRMIDDAAGERLVRV